MPTEAEWEFACRAGTLYADLTTAGWYYDNSDDAGGKNTHPVGQKQANAWGLRDMHGNVWEWCWDGLGAYTSSAKTDPCGDGSATTRVRRGGSWGFSDQNCRSANRGNDSPDYRINDLGFRPAFDAAP
jgi:formylglycine-generating enzyme required for sulfatase activity